MPKSQQTRSPERRRSEGRREHDGDGVAVQRFSDHALAHSVLATVNRVLQGGFGLGGLWIIKETVTPFAANTTTTVDAAISLTVSATATLAVTGTWGLREWKMRGRKKEIEELRALNERLKRRDPKVRAVNKKREGT